MLIPKPLDVKTKLVIAIAFALWLATLACSVNVKDHEGDQKSKVDIETPVGGIHVSQDADARDTGLTVYPGARKRQKANDGDEKSASVNISSRFFGVRVAAIEYESDDPPEKIISYYQDQLKKYGQVIKCRTNEHGGDLEVTAGDHKSEGAHQVTCKGSDSGKIVELKVGTEDNQHLVSVEPQGKGSDFALVYVQARGKEGTI